MYSKYIKSNLKFTNDKLTPMNEFIDLLEELDCDVSTIINFKKKINKPIEYKKHLEKIKFTKKWFAKLDYILIQLGYRALDADINYIKSKITDLINSPILDFGIKKIDDLSTNKNFTRWIMNYIQNKTNNSWLSFNQLDIAVFYLIKHPHMIDWEWFSQNENENAVRYSLKHTYKINWDRFSRNGTNIAVRYLIENPDRINWTWFSYNKADLVVEYLIKNPDKIRWEWFSINTNDNAVRYLIENPDKIYWWGFSKNVNSIAVKYSLNYKRHLIDTYYFSLNENDLMVEYLIKHPNRISWYSFSKNENYKAVRYCIKRRDKINWDQFLTNTNLDAIKFMMDNNKECKYLQAYNLYIEWKKYEFNKLDWLPKSGLKL